eukprot:3039083-Amphidinium_carterae.1
MENPPGLHLHGPNHATPECPWFLTRSVRNKRMHAQNGNQSNQMKVAYRGAWATKSAWVLTRNQDLQALVETRLPAVGVESAQRACAQQ